MIVRKNLQQLGILHIFKQHYFQFLDTFLSNIDLIRVILLKRNSLSLLYLKHRISLEKYF